MTKRRNIIATIRPSRFKIGQLVSVEGDCNGNYHGQVVETHSRLAKWNAHEDIGKLVIAPGITLRVLKWEGIEYKHIEGFEIIAHDVEVLQHGQT